MVLDSEVEALGACVPVSREGNLVLQNDALVFDPDRVEALGRPVPRGLMRGLLRGVDFSYPMDESPFELTVSDAEVHKGRLVLSGEVESLPVG